MDRRTATLLILCVLVLALIPLGVAVFVLGFALGDTPCILCWGQRIGMGLVALLGAFILRYGPRPKYIGLGILTGAYGIYMALRQAGGHLTQDLGQGFALVILGAHTYVWSLFIFWICVIVMGILLITLKEGEIQGGIRDLGRLGRLTLATLMVVLAANALEAFVTAGPPPFVGPGNPVRFSWNPRNWAWTLEEWQGGGPSLRGDLAIPKPNLAALNQDPAAGPFTNLPTLAVKSWLKLPVELKTPSAMAWDAASQRFAVAAEGHRIALLDPNLVTVLRWTRVDPDFVNDLGHGFVGVAFHKGGVLAMAENKSWVTLKEAPAGAKENWSSFLENRAAFEDLDRDNFATIRARLNYVTALAAGPHGLYTAALPNAKGKALVISRFDPNDLILAEEFVPETNGPVFANGRSLSDLAPVGLAVDGDRLFMLSGAFATLIEIDLPSHRVTRAWAIPGLPRPTGLTLRGTNLLVIGADGRVAVLSRP